MTPLESMSRTMALAAFESGLARGVSMESGLDYQARAWMEYLPLAAAALSVIREPSEEMADAGADKLFGSASEVWQDDAKDVWQAMIDTAIEQG